MGLFKRRTEEIDEEDTSRTVKIRDLKSQNRRKRDAPVRPWGKKERVLVGVIFVSTVVSAVFLAFSARRGKLPGLPRVTTPNFGFSETVILENKTPTPVQREISGEIIRNFNEATGALSGVYALSVVDLRTGASFGVNQNEVMEAASLIKLPVMTTAFLESEDGRFALDTKYTLREADKVGGSGSIVGRPAGTQFTYRELIKYMGQQSDNTAFNVIHNKLGDSTINANLSLWGMKNTSVSDNTTTAFEIANLLKRIYEGSLITNKDATEMFTYLTKTIYEDYLPKGVPEDVQVAHKYGRLVHVINDAGVVFASKPYVVVIMTGGVVESEAEKIIPHLSEIVYNGMEQ